MYFEGNLTDTGGGKYTGVLRMVNEAALPVIGDGISGYDLYAKNGATAWFGDDPSSGPVWTSQAISSDHDAWPTWNPDTPDWYQYSLELSKDDGGFKWAVRNHPGATAANPWYDDAPGWPKPPMGVPMSGKMHWTKMYAAETDIGAYLPGTGTPEIPGGAAGKGGGAQCWDMDWSWGSEVVPLEFPGFAVAVEDLGGGNYRVTLTPAPMPCITIKDGILTYSAGHYLDNVSLMLGNDPYGYNYQAHKFNGSYFNSYAGKDGFPPYEGDTDSYLADNPSVVNHWAWPYREVDLSMKWNDAWLSNKDCDGDGLLDRYYGFDSYIGCGAWLTNHQSGSYEANINGKTKTAHWSYFVKIVAPLETANKIGDIWYNADGVEIGPSIWGSFARIQQVENDPFAGIHGKQYGSPAGPGFGQYAP
jgi:hypothetical protein